MNRMNRMHRMHRMNRMAFLSAGTRKWPAAGRRDDG